MTGHQVSIGFQILFVCLIFGCTTTNTAQVNRSESSMVPTPSPQVLNPIFAVSEEKARQAFDQYKKMGEKRQKVTIGEEQALDVPVQAVSTAEKLKLAIVFFTPLEHARKTGYEFGLVAKTKTPEDLKAVRNAAVNQAIQNGRSVTFQVKTLAIPKDLNISGPVISFVLVNENGNRIGPTTTPISFIPPENDLITAVAWADEGQELTFPLFNDSVPNLTNTMQKMTLVVRIDDRDRSLAFSLKRP